MTEIRATSILALNRAASGDSLRPLGPTRGIEAVAWIAARQSRVSGAAWPWGLAMARASPDITRFTPSLADGSG